MSFKVNGKIAPDMRATREAVAKLQEHFNSRIGPQIRGDRNTTLARVQNPPRYVQDELLGE